MTTPAGPISLGNVQTEFGGGNPISLSEYYRGGANVPSNVVTSAVDGVLISASGAIRLGMFRSTTKQVNFVVNRVVSSTTANLNIRTAAIAAGWNQTTPLTMTVTVNSGVVLYSANTSQAALITGSGYPAGSTITLINNGTIQGAGGFGGSGASVSGATFTPATQGQGGGMAILVSAPITIYNYGTIAGGAGGGGGGGAARGYYSKTGYYGGGGGGGGGGLSYGSPGAGGTSSGNEANGNGSNGTSGGLSTAGAGGARFVVSGVVGTGPGGNGGALGQPGATGSNPDTSNANFVAGGWVAGAAGGAVGTYVNGNNNVIWAATGTRLGSVVA